MLSVTVITNLSNNTGDSEDPRIAASDNNVYAVWQDNTPGNSEIFFAASSDSGTSFTSSVNLSNTSQDSIAPQIAVSGSNVYVAWIEKVSSSNWEVFFRRSTNGGASFDNAINLSNSPGISALAQILPYGNNVYLTFEDNTAGNYEVFFRRSTNGGASFDTAINLSNNPSSPSFGGKIAISKNRVYVMWFGFDSMTPNAYQVLLRVSQDNGASFQYRFNVSNDNSRDARYPDIAVNGESVYIVWESFVLMHSDVREIFFNKSVNGGATFGKAISLNSHIMTGSFPPGISVRPQLAAAGNNVYVVWMQGDFIDFTDGDIAFIRSTNRGNSFDTAINLSDTPGGISEYPRIGVVNNKATISIVWEDRTGSYWEIFMKNSMDCGATFSGVINLSNSAGISRIPNIASSSKKDYFVWQDKTPGNFEVFFVSADNPDKFGSPVNLSNNNGSSRRPLIETSQANVHIIWEDNTTGIYQIYYKKSSDNGVTFGPTINLSNTPQNSFFPQIAVSGSNVYVVWVEHNQNWKILFRASTDGGMSFGPTLELSENTLARRETPKVAVSGSNVYVIWRDPSIVKGEIYLRVSTDNGSTFGNIINVSSSPTISGYPEIAVSGSNVYVVWMEIAVNSDYDILFRSSNDNGVTFGPTINLSDNSGRSEDEQIAVSGSNVYVVWRDNTPANFGILFRSSNDNGVTFGPTINLSNTPQYSFQHRIAVSGSNVYVVFAESDVLLRRSTNGGASFDNAVNLSNRGGFLKPRIAVSGSNIYIVWGGRNLFFISSRDDGLTFDCNIIDITGAVTEAADPRIALSDSNILVVWNYPASDDPAINSEIFLVQGQR